MKKFLSFLRSMKFGILLLTVLAVISVFGSLIPQNEPVMTYVRSYPDYYSLILSLQLNRVFTSWYFVLTVALLCINLTLCSITRFSAIRKGIPLSAIASAKADVPLTDSEKETVRNYLSAHHFQKKTVGESEIWTRHLFGRYGTFITHLGILLTVFFFALGMGMPVIIDRTCYPGESIVLDDGTRIYVDSFSITDETGKLDYKSVVNITLKDGTETGLQPVSVNHPLSAGDYKVFQQTYGTQGHITVTDTKGNQDGFYVESGDFLSPDGKSGILIDNLYPGIEETEDGIRMITSTSGRYENPVYIFMTMGEADSQAMLAFPGESIELGDYTYMFDPPVEYPGLRIKHAPRIINILLLISVLILTAGLFITFLTPAEYVTVNAEGYHITGSKSEGLALALKRALQESGKENKHD